MGDQGFILVIHDKQLKDLAILIESRLRLLSVFQKGYMDITDFLEK